MSELIFRNVRKEYDGGIVAVENFSLRIAGHEFISILGPSGSGKTTILRLVAGLERVSSGEIECEGRDITNLLPKERDVAMVFQSYALFPHISVYKNIRIGTLNSHLSKSEEGEKIGEMAEFFGITELLKRMPNTLSGGQRQRVALARALVRQPKILLLDEPLASLDAKLRTEMQSELMRIKNRFETTFLFVTHDQTEAMTMSDRIVLMNEGRIEQVGTPKEIYRHPSNRFVAEFIGTPKMNFIPLVCLKKYAQEDKGNNSNEEGAKEQAEVGIRPNDIYTYKKQENMIPIRVRIEIIEENGSDSILHTRLVGAENQRLVAKIDADHTFKSNEIIDLYLDSTKFHQF